RHFGGIGAPAFRHFQAQCAFSRPGNVAAYINQYVPTGICTRRNNQRPGFHSTENLGVIARVGRCSTFLSSTYGAVTAVEIRLPGPPFAPPTSCGALLKIEKFNPPRLGTME